MERTLGGVIRKGHALCSMCEYADESDVIHTQRDCLDHRDVMETSESLGVKYFTSLAGVSAFG